MVALLSPNSLVSAQSDSSEQKNGLLVDYVTLHSIIIDGNRKTKPQIILRELTFFVDDTITLPDLTVKMERRNSVDTLSTSKRCS